MIQRYVCGFMFSEDRSRVLLIEKNRPKWQKGKLNGIGGKLENYDASIYAAMAREFEEETGIKTEYKDWSRLVDLYGKDYTVYFYYCFSDKMYDAFSKTDEKVYNIRVSRLNYKSNLIPNLKVLIPLALDESGILKPVELHE